MAKKGVMAQVVNFVAWVTGVLVSLAVGFGLIDEVLSVRFIPIIVTVVAGWIVVVLTILGVILALLNK